METENRNFNGNPSGFNVINELMFLNTDTYKPKDIQNDLDLQNHQQQQEDPLLIVDETSIAIPIPHGCNLINTDEDKSKLEENVNDGQLENDFLQEYPVQNIHLTVDGGGTDSVVRYTKFTKVKSVKKCVMKKKKYPCPVCRKNCPTSSTRKRHINGHFGKRLTACLHCGKLFLHKEQYFWHHHNHSTKKKPVDNAPPHSVDIKTEKIDLEVLRIENCYQCEFCSVTFVDTHSLNLHYYCDHPNEIVYNTSTIQCNHCDRSFNSLARLKRHVSVHQKRHYSGHDKRFECKICRRRFAHPTGLKKHLNVHLGAEPFRCAICLKAYKTTTTLKSHLYGHHRKQSKRHVDTVNGVRFYNYKCQYCRKGFVDEGKYERHLKRYVEVECKCCGKIVYKPYLQKHIETHVAAGALTCYVCGRRFGGRIDLLRHLRLEQRRDSEDIVSRCDVCGQHFFQKGSLKYHVRVKHGDPPGSERFVRCRICDETFASRVSLYEHKNARHSAIKCDRCSETFTSKNGLRTHIRDAHIDTVADTEMKSPVYECGTCRKTFRKTGDYRSHLKNHESHSCRICDEQIGAIHKLIRHLDSHIGDKPFDCRICTKRFEYKKALQVHLIAEHKGIKDTLYECGICSYNYHHKTFLTKHIAKTHIPDYSNMDADASSIPEFRYNCQTCQRGYNDDVKFERHLKQHEYRETCVHCDVTFDNPTDFRAHFGDHANALDLTCNVCSKTYTHKGKFRCHLLAEHRRLTKKAVFVCAVCSKGFHRQSSLDSHVKIVHPNAAAPVALEAVYTCPVCLKPFVEEVAFRAHFKRHNFLDVCKICGKEFTARTHLYKHLEEHVGDDCACVICGRTFTGRRSLKDHLDMEQRKNSDKFVMKCAVCGYHFFHKMQYNKHVKYDHVVKEEPEAVVPEFMASLDLRKNN